MSSTGRIGLLSVVIGVLYTIIICIIILLTVHFMYIFMHNILALSSILVYGFHQLKEAASSMKSSQSMLARILTLCHFLRLVCNQVTFLLTF